MELEIYLNVSSKLLLNRVPSHTNIDANAMSPVYIIIKRVPHTIFYEKSLKLRNGES